MSKSPLVEGDAKDLQGFSVQPKRYELIRGQSTSFRKMKTKTSPYANVASWEVSCILGLIPEVARDGSLRCVETR